MFGVIKIDLIKLNSNKIDLSKLNKIFNKKDLKKIIKEAANN